MWAPGTEFDVLVGAVAAGGSCVARHEGRVIFVRHSLPGERVRVRVTADSGGSFARGDAVVIHEPALARIAPRCPVSGPDGCGGCDYQHVDPVTQREWKTSIVTEQLRRVAKLSDADIDRLKVEVESLGTDYFWRDRLRLTADTDGALGMRKYRSHELVPIARCFIADPSVADVETAGWAPGDEVVRVAGDEPSTLRNGTLTAGPQFQSRTALGRTFRVHAGGFWQTHPGAADRLAELVIAGLAPRAAETALDLYAGVGLFAVAMAQHGTHVTAIESDRSASADARHNVAGLPVKVLRKPVATALRDADRVDLVVLDPPRAGAGKTVVKQIAALQPRGVAYVSCDPATLARDLATFATLGYDLDTLHALDAFPMTHHIECVAILRPTGLRDSSRYTPEESDAAGR